MRKNAAIPPEYQDTPSEEPIEIVATPWSVKYGYNEDVHAPDITFMKHGVPVLVMGGNLDPEAIFEASKNYKKTGVLPLDFSAYYTDLNEQIFILSFDMFGGPYNSLIMKPDEKRVSIRIKGKYAPILLSNEKGNILRFMSDVFEKQFTSEETFELPELNRD